MKKQKHKNLGQFETIGALSVPHVRPILLLQQARVLHMHFYLSGADKIGDDSNSRIKLAIKEVACLVRTW